MCADKLRELSKFFYVAEYYVDVFGKMGLDSIEGMFSFTGAEDLNKAGLAGYRERICFTAGEGEARLYLKRYDKAPFLSQLKNWFCHRKRGSFGYFDYEPSVKLSAAGIKTYRTVAYGSEWGTIFETRSFSITEEIREAKSLERRLPQCFYERETGNNLKQRRDIILRLADFVSGFHETGYRHRDLYFSHIFYDSDGRFYVIDLSRCFKPAIFSHRYRVKDIAQLFYSAAGKYFSWTDRLRFYLRYSGRNRLTELDKSFIRKVIRRAHRMRRHDLKHDKTVPYES